MLQILSFAVLLLISNVNGQAVVTPSSAPPTSVVAIAPTITNDRNGVLPSYTGAAIYTPPTTSWAAPSFPTSSALPLCSEATCPSSQGQRCQGTPPMDGTAATQYGVVCSQRFKGVVITSSGKHRMMEMMRERKRGYTRTLETCTQFCDQYGATLCKGVDFGSDGYCNAYSAIEGSEANEQRMALVRLS